ncbi:MerC domain-containing protein [Gilvibacter sp.]|uniref:MerC domain-containing protein n=1 Tax=Gilvibacter sp. TaxID=2729997 RepID=UPI003F49E98F
MKNQTLDKLAITTSICCALHCAVVPLLLGITALTGLRFLENPMIEMGFVAVGIFLAVFSLGRGALKHKNHSPIRMAIIGIVLLVVSRFEIGETLEVVITVMGSLFLIISHSRNINAFKAYERSIVSEN